MKSKLAKSNAIIYKASKYLDKRSLKTLYGSLYLPYLSYCSEVWGNTYHTYIESLYLLQKKVIRTISQVERLEHTNPLFLELKLLKLHDIIDLKIAIIMFKVKQKQLSPNIMKHFIRVEDSYRTRHTRDFMQVYTRTTHKSKNISVYGVKLWNQLEQSLIDVPSLKAFKYMFRDKVLLKYENCVNR